MQDAEQMTSETSSEPMVESTHESPEGAEGGQEIEEGGDGQQADVPEWQRIKHRVKVDGEELEVPYEELKKGYSRMSAANKRFAEAAKQLEQINADKQQIASMLQSIQQNPADFLRQTGVDPVQFAEHLLYKQMEAEKMSPEQRRVMELEQKLATYEQEKEEMAKTQQQREFEAQEQKYVELYQSVVDKTCELAGVPKNQANINRIAQYIQVANANGLELDPSEFSQQLTEELRGEFGSLFGGLDGEKLFQLLGEEGAKKLRTFDMGRLKDPAQGRAQVREQSQQSFTSDGERKPIADFFEDARKRMGLS